MTVEDRELRDDALRRALRETLGRERAPESWVREALAVPARVAPPASPKKEPVVVVLLPHLAGLALLAGFLASMIIRPAAFGPIMEELSRIVPAGSLSPDTLRLLQTGLAAGALVILFGQGAQGFPILRRIHHRN